MGGGCDVPFHVEGETELGHALQDVLRRESGKTNKTTQKSFRMCIKARLNLFRDIASGGGGEGGGRYNKRVHFLSSTAQVGGRPN